MIEGPGHVPMHKIKENMTKQLEAYFAPGIVLMIVVLAAFLRLSFAAWMSDGSERLRMKKASSIAVCAVCLHSIVDYPLRTETIAILTALALGQLATDALKRQRRANERDAVSPAHIII